MRVEVSGALDIVCWVRNLGLVYVVCGERSDARCCLVTRGRGLYVANLHAKHNPAQQIVDPNPNAD